MADESGGKSSNLKKEVESGFMLITVETQLMGLATKISEVEIQCTNKGR